MDSATSAQRVFEFLAYFEKVRRHVSVAEVARHYGHPISSVSSVMRTMVGHGYLSYDQAERTYLPTARLPFLVNWVGTLLYDAESVRAMMQELSEATGETILLGAQNGIRVHFIDVVDATGPVRLHAAAGSSISLAHGAVGLALLSRFDEAQLAPLVRQINQQEADPVRHVQFASLRDRLIAVRRDGYAITLGSVVAGVGAIAMLLPHSVGATPLALGIASIDSNLSHNREHFVAALRGAIDRHAAAAPAGL